MQNYSAGPYRTNPCIYIVQITMAVCCQLRCLSCCCSSGKPDSNLTTDYKGNLKPILWIRILDLMCFFYSCVRIREKFFPHPGSPPIFMSLCRILSTLCRQVVFHIVPHFGKRAGQKVQRKIAAAVQKVKSPLLFVPLF